MGTARWRFLLVMVLLASNALACSLSWNGDDSQNDGDSGGGSGGSGSTPVVTILDPYDGFQVAVGQRVDLTVQTDSTATSFLLNVNDRVASSKALPPGQAGPSKAILSWTPVREGTYSLEVVAFNGSNASQPSAVLLTVAGTSAPGPGVTTSGCTARVLVSNLNFRDGPGTGYGRLGQFDVGETLVVLGRNGDTSWYLVQRSNAQQVWVVNDTQWMQTEGQCGGLPVSG